MKRAVAVLIGGCALVCACGANSAAQPPAPANLPTPAQEPTIDASEPTRENPSPTAPTPVASQAQPEPAATPDAVAAPATPLDTALAWLVAGAQADLARRRSVAIDAIEVAEVRSVIWPDPSLGCPQPGMAYKQVPVDGVAHPPASRRYDLQLPRRRWPATVPVRAAGRGQRASAPATLRSLSLLST